MKKSKMPFGSEAKFVVFKARQINFHDDDIHFGNGVVIPINLFNVLEVVRPVVALKYHKLFKESAILSESIPSQRVHLTEDGWLKHQFENNRFQVALYSLKLKFPQYICSAYVCRECGYIHLGKQKL